MDLCGVIVLYLLSMCLNGIYMLTCVVMRLCSYICG